MKHSLKSIPFSFSYPRRSAFILGWLFLLLPPLLASTNAFAQGGGKAEPGRIEFRRGTSSTTISGSVRGDEEAEYVLAARQGQKLVIKLNSVPGKSAAFQILGPDSGTSRLDYQSNFGFSGELPATGDYFISVRRPSSAKGRSRYRLTITIR
jgi:hypothetical protein